MNPIDYPPIPECLHKDQTFGEICVKCNECGIFDKPPLVRFDVRIITQHNQGIPPGWQYPETFGGLFEGRDRRGKSYKTWFRRDKLIEKGKKLSDIISEWWYPDRLPYLRWWLELRKY